MYASTEEFIAFLEQKNVKYTYEGVNEKTKKDKMRVRYRGDNVETIEIQFFFSEDCEDVAVRVFNIAKVPQNKVAEILQACNEQNNRYRFMKFCYDPDDSTLQAEADLPIRVGTIGPVCHEIMGRAVNICDGAYPAFMKTIFA